MRIESVPLLPPRASATPVRPSANTAAREPDRVTADARPRTRAVGIDAQRSAIYPNIQRDSALGGVASKAAAAYGHWRDAEHREYIRQTLGIDAYA